MRRIVALGIVLAVVFRLAQLHGQIANLDLLIRGGTVMDGTGSEPVTVDIGIAGNRIAFIGDAGSAKVTASRTLDAAGLIVAPGFIDPHTHTFDDLNTPGRNSNLPYLMQGVTTVVTGNDGGGPISPASSFELWQKQGIGTNAALYVGQGTIRRTVMNMTDATPSSTEMERMKAMVSEAMDSGALGLSTGLYYAPGSYSTTEEVIELAKMAAAKGGIYDSHMRDESSYTIGLLGSIQETIRIGREARIPVHISHIKALGTDVWGKSAEAIQMIQRARSSGVDVTADQYPYLGSGTSVSASLLPRWAEVGGRDELLKRIADPSVRPRLVAEMEVNLKRRGGADTLLIVGGSDPQIVGKRLDAVAKEWNKTPVDAAVQIIKNGGAGVVSFNMNDQDVDAFMRQDWVMTGSDGSDGHPRKYGTFPRKMREYVLNKKIISMPFAVRSSSALTAETLHIPERGRLTPGYYADVIVFDEKVIADKSTYEQPTVLAAGMKYVIVNGKVAVDSGKFTGVMAGRPVKRNGME